MRIIVTGSRQWTDAQAIDDAFEYVARHFPDTPVVTWTVVHGDCPTGADQMCNTWAVVHGATPEPHPANWGNGRHAGFDRNQEMVDLTADFALGFAMPCDKRGCRKPKPHTSHGTHDCLERIVGAHIPRFVTWRGFP